MTPLTPVLSRISFASAYSHISPLPTHGTSPLAHSTANLMPSRLTGSVLACRRLRPCMVMCETPAWMADWTSCSVRLPISSTSLLYTLPAGRVSSRSDGYDRECKNALLLRINPDLYTDRPSPSHPVLDTPYHITDQLWLSQQRRAYPFFICPLLGTAAVDVQAVHVWRYKFSSIRQ